MATTPKSRQASFRRQGTLSKTASRTVTEEPEPMRLLVCQSSILGGTSLLFDSMSADTRPKSFETMVMQMMMGTIPTTEQEAIIKVHHLRNSRQVIVTRLVTAQQGVQSEIQPGHVAPKASRTAVALGIIIPQHIILHRPHASRHRHKDDFEVEVVCRVLPIIQRQLRLITDCATTFLESFKRSRNIWAPGGGLFSMDAEMRQAMSNHVPFVTATNTALTRLTHMFTGPPLRGLYAIQNLNVSRTHTLTTAHHTAPPALMSVVDEGRELQAAHLVRAILEAVEGSLLISESKRLQFLASVVTGALSIHHSWALGMGLPQPKLNRVVLQHISRALLNACGGRGEGSVVVWPVRIVVVGDQLPTQRVQQILSFFVRDVHSLPDDHLDRCMLQVPKASSRPQDSEAPSSSSSLLSPSRAGSNDPAPHIMIQSPSTNSLINHHVTHLTHMPSTPNNNINNNNNNINNNNNNINNNTNANTHNFSNNHSTSAATTTPASAATTSTAMRAPQLGGNVGNGHSGLVGASENGNANAINVGGKPEEKKVLDDSDDIQMIRSFSELSGGDDGDPDGDAKSGGVGGDVVMSVGEEEQQQKLPIVGALDAELHNDWKNVPINDVELSLNEVEICMRKRFPGSPSKVPTSSPASCLLMPKDLDDFTLGSHPRSDETHLQERNVAASLHRDYGESWMSDFVIQGVKTRDFIPQLANEMVLEASDYLSFEMRPESLIVDLEKRICTRMWSGQTQLHRSSELYRRTIEGIQNEKVGTSKAILDMLSEVIQLHRIGVTPVSCVAHIQQRLQSLCAKAQLLMSAHGTSIRTHLHNPAFVAALCRCHESDVPLLLSLVNNKGS